MTISLSHNGVVIDLYIAMVGASCSGCHRIDCSMFPCTMLTVCSFVVVTHRCWFNTIPLIAVTANNRATGNILLLNVHIAVAVHSNSISAVTPVSPITGNQPASGLSSWLYPSDSHGKPLNNQLLSHSVINQIAGRDMGHKAGVKKRLVR